MRIDPWRTQGIDFRGLHPNLLVHVPELIAPGAETSLLCDVAFTTKGEALGHHWFSRNDENDVLTVLEMDLRTFLRRHRDEVPATNPFWAVGRTAFLDGWQRVHGLLPRPERRHAG